MKIFICLFATLAVASAGGGYLPRGESHSHATTGAHSFSTSNNGFGGAFDTGNHFGNGNGHVGGYAAGNSFGNGHRFAPTAVRTDSASSLFGGSNGNSHHGRSYGNSHSGNYAGFNSGKSHGAYSSAGHTQQAVTNFAPHSGKSYAKSYGGNSYGAAGGAGSYGSHDGAYGGYGAQPNYDFSVNHGSAGQNGFHGKPYLGASSHGNDAIAFKSISFNSKHGHGEAAGLTGVSVGNGGASSVASGVGSGGWW